MRLFRWIVVLWTCFAASWSWAGGSGLNVAVVVNQHSTNSMQLGNYYAEQRDVPPQNIVRIHWSGSRVEWTRAEFENTLLHPLLAALQSRSLTGQIDFILLSMDIPYRVKDTGMLTSGENSTTSAIFYGFKSDGPIGGSCSRPADSANSYAGSEDIFRSAKPLTAPTNSFLAVMLTSSNLAQAKALVDRAVLSDGTFPTQTAYLAKSDDRLRNIRYRLFDNAIFNVRLRGLLSIERTNINTPNPLAPLLGYQNGAQQTAVATNIFVPGALADQMTSFGGKLFDTSDHTTALAFLNAGAIGSFGTVVEPCADLHKFPSPQNYFYQSRGFTMAESYYQSVTNPHQGVVVGEPLAAPFAQLAGGVWNHPPSDALLAGTTNLSVQFTAADSARPVQQVDLFVNGRFAHTLTNIPPRMNNVLNVTINGHAMNYTVLAGETVKSVAAGLATVLNLPSNTALTKVQASARGDRIELRSQDIAKRGSQVPISAGSSIGIASALTTFVSAGGAGTSFMETPAHGIRSYVITNVPQVGSYLRMTVIKTNGQTIVTSVTNETSGTILADFARSLFQAVNTNPQLTGPDGVVIEDVNMHEDEPYRTFVYGPNDHSGEFNIRARSPGWPESQVQVALTGSPSFGITPSGTNRLDANVADLQPRQHLYIAAGVTNLPLTFAFNTTTQANGFHGLTAVAYEGSHVRTQRRVSRSVRVQNSALSAAFTPLFGGTNAALGATLEFQVGANTNNISTIELFTTGGLLATVSGQSNATFSISAANLGLGLHPFYALVTGTNGEQFRTETKWVRLVSADAPFPLTITAPPPTLSWPAIAGATYDILSATNVAGPYQLRDTVTATNANAQWSDTLDAPQRFYRIRTAP